MEQLQNGDAQGNCGQTEFSRPGRGKTPAGPIFDTRDQDLPAITTDHPRAPGFDPVFSMLTDMSPSAGAQFYSTQIPAMGMNITNIATHMQKPTKVRPAGSQRPSHGSLEMDSDLGKILIAFPRDANTGKPSLAYYARAVFVFLHRANDLLRDVLAGGKIVHGRRMDS
uniref:Uncharacterized protein n=1 Tax=Anopheles farauti TaxID=69004 RepID=A0A182QBY0_9DIPT